MVKKGDIVIAGDPDIEDLYICEVLEPAGNFRENLKCRVLEPVQYPAQHAVMHPDIPSENPPLPAGGVAMLRFTAFVQGYAPTSSGAAVPPSPKGKAGEASPLGKLSAEPTEEVVRLQPMAEYYRETGAGGYAGALRRAREEYQRKLMHKLEFQSKHPSQRWLRANPGELAILERHGRGLYEGRRSCLWSE